MLNPTTKQEMFGYFITYFACLCSFAVINLLFSEHLRVFIYPFVPVLYSLAGNALLARAKKEN